MSWEVSASFEQFAAAAAWFRARIPMLKDRVREMSEYSGPRAFWISGVTQLDVVQDVFDSIAKAIDNGQPFDKWKREIEPKLTDAWGKRNSPRVETIFRNATTAASNAGRWREMQHPAVKQLRPYVFFDGVEDSRQSEICQHWNGLIRPADDPVWESATPPLHHRCRSQLRTMRRSEAMKRGGPTPTLPDEKFAPQKGFGASPDSTRWTPDPQKYDREAFAEYQNKREMARKLTRRPTLEGDQ